jgi:integrase
MQRAVLLARYTGQRQADVLRMGPGDIEDVGIVVVQQKTGKELWVPLHSNLRGAMESWDSSPYVVNQRGASGLHLRPLQIGLGRLHGRDACRQDQGGGLRLPWAARVELREAP